MEMQKHSGPRTLRGTYMDIRRTHSGNGLPTPPMKEVARSIVRAGVGVWSKAVVEDSQRWLTAKSGGTQAERKARADRRKDHKAANYAAKLAKRGKGKLKSSSEGSERGRK